MEADDILLSVLGNVQQSEEDIKIDELSRDLIQKPINEWPDFEVLWDCSLDGIRFLTSDRTGKNLANTFPQGVYIGYVNLLELDLCLCRHSSQTVSEFWTIGFQSKKSTILAEWILGKSLTPCRIEPHPNLEGQIMIGDGNHRLAVSRAKGEKIVPVIIEPQYLDAIMSMISIESLEKLEIRT